MSTKCRADVALVERGFFASRAQAQAAIAAGGVSVDGVVLHKASQTIASTAEIIALAPHPWVSRGGLKLEAALDAFGFSPEGTRALDLGASTGGFTHVLLTRGAAHVHAVDVGHGQLHPLIANDPRVTMLEGTDARRLAESGVGPFDILTIDVSFISLKLVLSPVVPLLAQGAQLVALVKPQFEAGRAHLHKGIVRDAAIHTQVCDDIRAHIAGLGFTIEGLLPSPITGGDGNREFLLGAHLS